MQCGLNYPQLLAMVDHLLEISKGARTKTNHFDTLESYLTMSPPNNTAGEKSNFHANWQEENSTLDGKQLYNSFCLRQVNNFSPEVLEMAIAQRVGGGGGGGGRANELEPDPVPQMIQAKVNTDTIEVWGNATLKLNRQGKSNNRLKDFDYIWDGERKCWWKSFVDENEKNVVLDKLAGLMEEYNLEIKYS